MEKLKVVAVSYLNTKPLLYGIFNDNLEEELDIQLEIPSVCADKLMSGEADLGLVPVAVIPEMDTPYIISDYCIGCEKEVKSVAIYSDKPIEELTHIYLDYHSRTSVQLAQILMKKYWKLNPVFLPAKEGFIDKIGETTGAVVIGDRTIELDEKHPYKYDLGEHWYNHTGLPFVFAAWVSNKPLPDAFVKKFNAALEAGVQHIPQLVYLLPTPDKGFDLKEYFEKNISYHLDKSKRKALSLFLSELAPLQPTLQDSLLF